jgi:serine O-acetyltransferase
MFDRIKEDLSAVLRRDPAAKSALEVLLCYPGFQALLMHRLSHCLAECGMVLFARLIANVSRFLTGIEIHPAAVIGRRVVIDHGAGIVIGETAVVGDDVLLYQGVTLGGTGKERGKRHPTIGSNVVLGARAKVLGAITIGSHVKIGAGAVVIRSVPSYATVVGIPGRIVMRHTADGGQSPDRISIPNPESRTTAEEIAVRLSRIDTELYLLCGLLGERSPAREVPDFAPWRGAYVHGSKSVEHSAAWDEEPNIAHTVVQIGSGAST